MRFLCKSLHALQMAPKSLEKPLGSFKQGKNSFLISNPNPTVGQTKSTLKNRVDLVSLRLCCLWRLQTLIVTTLHLDFRYQEQQTPLERQLEWVLFTPATCFIHRLTRHGVLAPHLIFSPEFCFSGVSKTRCYYFHIIRAKTVSLSLKLFISLQLDLNLWLHHHNPRAITTRPHGPRAVFGGGGDVSYFRSC